MAVTEVSRMNCLSPQCRASLRRGAGLVVRLVVVGLVGFLIVYGSEFYDLLRFTYHMNQIQ